METMLQQGEVVDLTGTSRKTLLGYEELGLVIPARAENGYRLYSEHQVSVIRQIRRLNDIGIPLRDVGPFVDCLNTGSQYADSCPSTLGEYRRAIERIDKTISTLTTQRAALVENLTVASRRMLEEVSTVDTQNPNLAPLPEDLPEPEDDGATDHLPGMALPELRLPSTDGDEISLNDLGHERVLIYVFPMTGAPEQDMPEGWDAIPGARGCSPHNCDMRNHYAELVQAGISRVFGLSSQPLEYQRSLVEALRLSYPLLTDERMLLSQALGLPTFSAGNITAYRRLALLIHQNTVEHVFYPVFPPGEHAQVVLNWLREHPTPQQS